VTLDEWAALVERHDSLGPVLEGPLDSGTLTEEEIEGLLRDAHEDRAALMSEAARQRSIAREMLATGLHGAENALGLVRRQLVRILEDAE